jgi:hypothetical protein
MTQPAATMPIGQVATRAGLSVRNLLTGLLGLFALDNLLLLHFWGLGLPLTAAAALAAAAVIWALLSNLPRHLESVPYSVFAFALLISLALFALGGEGRFFYANTDWQIRDAVLHDMASHSWPFAYHTHATTYFLRAPIGMYLLPAMFGDGAEIALLFSNSLRLALLLSLGWGFFETSRDRAIALTIFILFSGWDCVGTLLYSAMGIPQHWDHIEPWNFGYQYSSHVTQAFWVPQHAIAGWTCAIAFLLWRRGAVPLGVFAALIPLVAIWSPLAIMGAVPFGLFAAWKERDYTPANVGAALLGAAIALPSLLYLQLDAQSVGMHLLRTNPVIWAWCIVLEVLPFAWPLLREKSSTIDGPVVKMILCLLLIMPFVQIGVSSDFQMRASIMPLALLSILFAQWIAGLLNEQRWRIAALAYAVIAVSLGAPTPLLELRRAVVNKPSPRPLCSLVGAWNRQDNLVVPYSTYLAPASMLPEFLAAVPETVGRSDPAQCWDRKWKTPAEFNP